MTIKQRKTELVFLIGSCFALFACESAFAPASELTTVRILGIRSDTPYVLPGLPFGAEVLAYDGRADQSSPMRLFWLDDVCVSPKNGNQGECYAQFEAKYPRYQDLTSLVKEGPQASFTLPSLPMDEKPRGIPNALVFVAACAGHLEFIGVSSQYPNQVPFACVDAEGTKLSDDDFVFGYFRFFIAPNLTNANPTPTAIKLDGVELLADKPFSVARCTASNVDDCPARILEVVIADDQQEVDPTSAPPGSTPIREQVWSSFFTSKGKLASEAVVLFNGRTGRVEGATNEFRGPITAGEFDLFVVTRDNRSGATFNSYKLIAE